MLSKKRKKMSRPKNSLWSKGLKYIAILALISLTIANKAETDEILYCATSLQCLHSLSIGDFQVKKMFKSYLCLSGPRCTKKTTLLHAYNKGTDQPVHPHSLISGFVIRLLERLMFKLGSCKINIFLHTK